MHITHPDDLDDHLTGRQLLDWQRYARRYGLPNRRNDLHHGMVMAMTYNMNRGEHDPAEPPSAFMPYHDQTEQPIEKEELEGKLRGLLAGRLHTATQQGGIPSA